MGRPKKQLTPEQLKTAKRLAGYGLHSKEIASNLEYIFGISICARTLRTPRFKELLSQGVDVGKRVIIQRLDRMSRKGNVVATIFMAKNLCGWSDRTITRLTGLPIKQYDAEIGLPPARATFGYARASGGNGNGNGNGHGGNGDGEDEDDIEAEGDTEVNG